METLVWIGAAVTAAGFGAIIWSIVLISRARRENLSDDDLRARLHKILPVNLGGLFTAFLGLMLVVVGVILA
ncbi:hypothetical protein [Flavimaricola marinus]|uniref:Uncharacterized protein n=1 Tax=Flavimaricola marinus TaxID=1819565 RepID=A0A238LL35_9RHOB|nr:hypothetical protein [Flavimaricola marinus]SMY09580.1 hypothetical protein LOM8899_03747 [Flavimaricola marinus]